MKNRPDPRLVVVPSRPVIRRAAALAVLLAAGTLVGCEEKPDALAKSIRDARNTLVSISGAGGVSAASEYREQAYGRVISSLQAASRDASRPGSIAAVHLLMAQAQAGQADIEAAKARDALGQMQMQLNDARAKLELYISHRSLATSMATLDPTAPVKEFDAQIEMMGQSLRAVEEQQRRAQDDLAAANAESQEMRAQAQEVRARANSLAAEAMSLDGTARAERVAQASTVSREADGIEKRLSLHLLKVDELTRMSEELARQARSVERQRQLLDEAKQRASEGQRTIADSVSKARTDADAAADELDRAIDQLREMIRTTLVPAFDAAVAKYNDASSSASRARQAERQSQTHAVSGGYDHAAATLQLSYAESLGQVVELLERMTNVSPALPGRDSYLRLKTELAQAAQAASTAAGESFGKAASAYQSAQVPGAAKEVFVQLGEEMARLERRLKGQPEPEPVIEEPEVEQPAGGGLGFGAATDDPPADNPDGSAPDSGSVDE